MFQLSSFILHYCWCYSFLFAWNYDQSCCAILSVHGFETTQHRQSKITTKARTKTKITSSSISSTPLRSSHTIDNTNPNIDSCNCRSSFSTASCSSSMNPKRNHNKNNRRLDLSDTSSISKQFHIQIMERIQERLHDFMSVPVHMTELLYQYYKKEGFPSGIMLASDRMEILKYILPLNTPPINILLYIALEDGTIIFYFDDYITMEYREPGNSGYKVEDIQETDPYYKHYTSCVDSKTGLPSNCTLDSGIFYVECINDCELIPCPKVMDNTTSSTDHTMTMASYTSNYNNYCYNYQVKTVSYINETTGIYVNETGLYGYVPTTDYCINHIGQPEQRNGYVLNNYQTQTYGNCYYLDKTTTVNRTTSGSYSSCGTKHNMMGEIVNGTEQVCNTTFVGGYKTGPYDPRVRPWYNTSKQAQRPIWTNSFAYYSYNEIGITYTHPIYKPYNTNTNIINDNHYNYIHNHTDDINNDTDHNDDDHNNDMIFHGVIAVDYPVQYVQKFLNEQFQDIDDTRIMVIEEIEPNYVIATNTGGPFTQFVSRINNTAPCRTNETIDRLSNCQIVRIPIMNIQTNNSDPNDIYYNASVYEYNDNNTRILSNSILQKAFIVHQNIQFLNNYKISYKVNDHIIGSSAYVAQRQYYQQEYSAPNSRWHIFVIIPMPRSTDDAVTRNINPQAFILTCILSTVGFISCFILFIIFYNKRNERVVQQSDYIFTCIFILGCSIINLSTFTLLGENTYTTCMLRMWTLNFLFVSALSPLFVKVWRMHSILKASAGFRRVKISHYQALLYTLPLCIMEIIILVIFTIVDPPIPRETLGVGNDDGSIGVQQIICEHNSIAFFITQLTFDAGLLLVGCILAYQSRDLDPKYGEAKQLCFSMYNIAVTGLLVTCTVSLVDLDQASITVLTAIGVLWGSFFSSLSFVLPRLLQVQREKRNSLLMTSSNSSLRGGSSSKHFNKPDLSNQFDIHDGPSSKFFEKPMPIVEEKEDDDDTEFIISKQEKSFPMKDEHEAHQMLDTLAQLDRDSTISIHFTENENTPDDSPKVTENEDTSN